MRNGHYWETAAGLWPWCYFEYKTHKAYWFVGLGDIAFGKWLFAQNGTLCLSKLRAICNLYLFLCVFKLIKRRGKCKT